MSTVLGRRPRHTTDFLRDGSSTDKPSGAREVDGNPWRVWMGMRNIESTSALTEPVSQGVLTIGNFDGIHRGHQLILNEVVRRARAMGGTSVVMSFDPPPGRVLGRQLAPQVMTMPDRARLAGALGVDVFITQPFTLELAHMMPLEFVEEILEAYIRPKVILVGYDFCFGRERQGDVHFLRAYYTPKGVEVLQLGPFALSMGALSTGAGSVEASIDGGSSGAQTGGSPGEIVSSSAIRRLVQAGDVERAAIMLGRPHLLSGRVVHGEARGRTIGFPTANLESETELLPANGVYATWLWVDGIRWPSVTNVGMRPTFEGQKLTIEAHLLDFSGDLYGKLVRLELVSRLRVEQKFAGLDSLKAQIARDVAEARLRVGNGSAGAVVSAFSPQASRESSAE